MINILLIIILLLIIACIISFLVIRCQRIENQELHTKISGYENSYFELNNRFEKLMEEIKIEKNHNKELAKKLADISCMSIDDVMHQLQDNNSNRKDNI